MRSITCPTALLLVVSAVARSQQPITRQQAIESAVARGARAAVARADTLVGTAQLLSARQWDNPSLSASYTKSTPRYHEIIRLNAKSAITLQGQDRNGTVISGTNNNNLNPQKNPQQQPKPTSPFSPNKNPSKPGSR